MDAKQLNSLTDFAVPNGNVPNLNMWDINPTGQGARQAYEEALVGYFTKEIMLERNITHEEAENWIDADKIMLIARGAERAMEVMVERGMMQEQAVDSLGFKLFKASIHAYSKDEPETFMDWLLLKFGDVKSEGELSEMKAMFELYDEYEKRGSAEFLEGLWQDVKGFSKFKKTTKKLREEMVRIDNIRKQMGGALKQVDLQLHNAATDEEHEQILTQRAELEEAYSEKLYEAQERLDDVVIKAVTLAKDPKVHATGPNGIVACLSRMTDDNPSGRLQKMPVDKFILPNATGYVIMVKPEFESVIERALGDFCEFNVTDPKVALEPLKKYMK